MIELSDPGPAPRRRGDLSADGTQVYDGEDWGWQPLWLPRDAVAPACAEQFGLEVDQVALLSDGFLNQSWRLRCADHDRVLRVSRSDRTLEQLRYEYELLSAWSAELDQVVAPERPPACTADGRLLTIFGYRHGVPGAAVAPATRVAQLLPLVIAMHRISLRSALPQRPGMQALDEDPIIGRWPEIRAAVLERYGRSRQVLEPVVVIDRAVDELTADIERWRRTGRLDVRAAVHGDLNPRNQLYRGSRLVGLIDADDCRVEPLIWDIAGLAYTDPDVDPAAVWASYRQAGGLLPPQDEELLLPMARIGVLTELQWCLDEDGSATHLALGNLHNIAAGLVAPVRD